MTTERRKVIYSQMTADSIDIVDSIVNIPQLDYIYELWRCALPQLEYKWNPSTNTLVVTLDEDPAEMDDVSAAASTILRLSEGISMRVKDSSAGAFLSMRHDSILKCITGEEENGQGAIFEVTGLSLSQTNIRPDYYDSGPEYQVTMELKTNSSDDLSPEQKSQLTTMSAQMLSLADKFTKPMIFHRVIVLSTQIESSYELPDEIIRDVSVHYLFYEACLQFLSKLLRWTFVNDYPVNEFKSIYKDPAYDLPEHSDRKFITTQEDLMRWSRVADTTGPEREVTYMSCLLKSATDRCIKDFTDPAGQNERYLSAWLKKHSTLVKRESTDLKRIVHFPWVDLQISDPPTWTIDDFRRHLFVPDEEKPLTKIICRALNNTSLTRERFETHVSEMLREAELNYVDYMKTEKARKEFRGLYHLAICNLTTEDEIYLVQRGVGAKKNSHLPSDHGLRLKKFIAWDCDVTDIDLFIAEAYDELFSPASEVMKPDMNIESLKGQISNMMKASGDALEDEHVDGYIKWFKSTKFYVWCTLISEIMTELAISVSSWIKESKGEFIVKKCYSFDVYLLIKPYGANKDLYYWLYFPKDVLNGFNSFGHIFSRMVESPSGYMTESQTINRHMISHFTNFAERMMAYHATWLSIYNVDWQNPSADAMNQFKRKFLAQFLLFCDPKHHTVDTFASLRYYYMELTLGDSSLPVRYNKVFDMIEPGIRSRLASWLIQRYVSTHKSPLNKNVVMGEARHIRDGNNEDDLPVPGTADDEAQLAQDELRNCTDIITGGAMRDTSIMINTCYLHHSSNEDNINQRHSSFAILKKIIEAQLKERLMRYTHCGRSEPMIDGTDQPDLNAFRTGENSMVFCCLVSRFVRRYLENKFGGKYEDWFYEQSYMESTKLNFTKYSTLKASMVPHNQETFTEEPRKMAKFNRRIKALEAVVDLIKTDPASSTRICVYQNLLKYYKLCVQDKHAMANLFQKNQKSGVREIYVLTISYRLLVSHVEMLSKVACGQLPPETMTNAKRKQTEANVFTQVCSEVMKQSGYKYGMMMTSSDDCAKWSPSFSPTAMANICFRVFPKDVAKFVISVLNIFADKRLELPLEVVRAMKSWSASVPGEVPTYDENLMELFKDIRDEPDARHDLTVKDGMFMKSETNFMQGILHYLSSMIHASFLMYVSHCQKVCFKHLTEKDIRTRGKVTELSSFMQCSSDDSRMILFCALRDNDPDLTRLVQTYMIRVGAMKEVSYPLGSMSLSVKKSTRLNPTKTSEYNSMFTFNEQAVNPLIKEAYNIGPKAGLDSKSKLFDNMVSSLRSISANGGGIWLKSVCQWAQWDMWWQLSGQKTNPLFSDYIQQLSKKPHVSLGLYLLSPSKSAGFFSANFNNWYYNKNWSDYSRTTNTLLFMGVLDTAPNSSPSINVVLKISKGSKSKDISERLGASRNDIVNFYNSKPSSLYRDPLTIEECRIWALSQLWKPSVSESLNFHALYKMMAYGMYWLMAAVVQIMDYENGMKIIRKCSMTALMNRLSISPRTLPEELSVMLYPNSSMYENFLSVSRSYNLVSVVIPTFRRKTREIVMQLPRPKAQAPLDFKTYFRAKYFGFTEGTTTDSVVRSHLIYQSVYPWLRESYTQTMLASPYSSNEFIETNYGITSSMNHMGLASFVNSHDTSSGSIILLGPVKSRLSYSKLFEMYFKFMYLPSHRLSRGYAPAVPRRDERPLMRDVSLLLTAPLRLEQDSGPVVAKYFSDFLSSSPLIWNRSKDVTMSDFFQLSEQEKRFALMQIFCKDHLIWTQSNNQVIKPGFMDLYRASKTGILGFFTEPQKKAGGVWSGSGQYQLDIGDVSYRIHLRDAVMSEILVYSESEGRLMRPEVFQANLTPLIRYGAKLFQNCGIKPLSQSKYKPPIGFNYYYNPMSGKIASAPKLGYVPISLTNFDVVVPRDENLRFMVDMATSEIKIQLAEIGKTQDIRFKGKSPEQAEYLKYMLQLNRQVDVLKLSGSKYLPRSQGMFSGNQVENPLIDNWLMQRPLNAGQARGLVTTASTSRDSRPGLSKWLKRTLSARVESLFGTYSSSIYTLTSKAIPAGTEPLAPSSEVMQQVDMLRMTEGVDYDISDYFSDIGQEENETEDPYGRNEIMDGIQAMDDEALLSIYNLDGYTKERHQEASVDDSHPYWDEYINYCLDNVGKPVFLSIVQGKTRFSLNPSHIAAIGSLYKLFDVDHRVQSEFGSSVPDHDDEAMISDMLLEQL